MSTLVTKAKNPLAVSDTDGPDVVNGPVPQDVIDVACVLDRDEHALRTTQDEAVPEKENDNGIKCK